MALKVLIVDDEADLEILIRERFRKQIKEGKLEFVFAANGEEALTRLEEDSNLEIVMSDINMPVMDGLTLLSRFSDIDRVLKMVIVSAYGDMQNIRTAMNRGVASERPIHPLTRATRVKPFRLSTGSSGTRKKPLKIRATKCVSGATEGSTTASTSPCANSPAAFRAAPRCSRNWPWSQ